jgi:hypothetical protein
MSTRVIKFRQAEEDQAYSYTLSYQPIKMGDYYYNRKLGAFFAVQHCLHESQTQFSLPVIIATDNPKYTI